MLEYVKTHLHRRALVAALTVSIAFMAQLYFAKTHECWMIFAAFLVCQTTRGTPLKQAFNYVFVLALFAIFIPPFEMDVIAARLYDTVIGAVIGIVISQLLLPRQMYVEFSRGLSELFSALTNDMQKLQESMTEEDVNEYESLSKKILSGHGDHYPEWVYEVGFNRALRGGFRFFLLHAEQLVEIIFSLNYLCMRARSSPLLELMRAEILRVILQNERILMVLKDYFVHNKMPDAEETDFTTDMSALESVLSKEVPVQLELLDITPDALVVTGIVRDLKDMRNILLSLLMALPSSK